MDTSFVLLELELAAVHKTQKKRKKNWPISSHLDLKLVNNAYGMWMRMILNKPTKTDGIKKHLQMRTLFMNDILYYESLYIYLRLDLNKHTRF